MNVRALWPANKLDSPRTFMDELGKELGFTKMEDWFKLTRKQLLSYGGLELLKTHKGSQTYLLQKAYPDHVWPLHEKNIENEFLELLIEQVGLKSKEFWYRLKRKDIIRYGGRFLLDKHKGSILRLLESLFPQHKWLPFHFRKVPKGYWNHRNHQKEFFDWLAQEFGFLDMEDWYQITTRMFVDRGGSSLLRFNNSISLLLENIYPNHRWCPWKFSHQVLPNGYWSNKKNQKDFMDWLGVELGLKEMEDWTKVERKELIRKGGSKFLNEYEGSYLKLLESVYPKHTWQINKNQTTPSHNNNKADQIDFMEKLAKKLGLKEMHDWYTVKRTDIINQGGVKLLLKYGNSPLKLLRAVYPEHKWLLSKLDKERHLGLIKEEIPDFLSWLTKELGIRNLNDWYRVSSAEVQKLGSESIFRGTPLEDMLQEAYPNHNWDISKLRYKHGIIRAKQRKLAVMLAQIFPNSVKEEYFHERLEWVSNQRTVPLDLFLPQENLAFEYQGEHHYYDIFALGSKWFQKHRDQEKKILCKENGITLIEVPYWWDFEKSSLIATIHQQRPDLLPTAEAEQLIPKEPVGGFPKGTVPELMHGEDWDGMQDLTGWWISEKMDGVRAYWNGKELISKAAKVMNPPNWFTAELPKGIGLDGELWLGRGRFENIMPILNTNDKPEWQDIQYVIFDLPHSNSPYELRMQEMKRFNFPTHVTVIENSQCTGNNHLLNMLQSIVELQGEGFMAMKPQSLYLPGTRTNTLLKVKAIKECEVQLLELIPTGLYCQQVNGKECIVGCSPQLIDNPPPVGSVLTVKHTGMYQNGTLRYAFFWRHRTDISWDDISHHQKLLAANAYWTNKQNCRDFFEKIRVNLGCQKFEDFLTLTPEVIRQNGGKALLDNMFDGSLAKLLQFVYPNHKWQPWKFSQNVPMGFWNKKENQREYMDWLGKEFGIKQMDDWYKVGVKELRSKGATGLLHKYHTSPSELLQSVYPEHKWSFFNYKIWQL